tara:strand:+ start:61 stop:444 length:384 start_codon:yes stop_codon:yes gene_type:complete
MIIEILAIIHLALIFLPIAVFFTPLSYIRKSFKYLFLILILIPIHWVFFDNQCLFTLASKEAGNMRNTETTSGFSEKYMKWLYKPIMDFIGWEWNSVGLDKMVNLHWGINFFLLWYFLFFIGKCKLI